MRRSKTLAKVPYFSPEVITKVVPTPTEGWDAISPLAEMDPKRAPILDNWVCRPGFNELRGGYIPYGSIGSSHPVESLMVWRGPSSEKMFAAANGNIYDASISGTTTTSVSGLGSNRWQYTNFTQAGGTTHYLQCANGVDPIQMYDNTNGWTVPSITGAAFSFPGSNTIVHINNQKRRLWYTQINSTVVWFMPTDAITGPVAGFLDLGALWPKGGYLVGSTSWTIDGGSGPQDYIAFISSRGEISLYSGTDPTNANVFALVGTFQVAPPIGRRCFTRVGSDVAIITQQGVVPLSQALPFDPSADRSVAITARIQNAMAASAMNYQSNFGWEFTTFPNQQLALLNVPTSENSSQQQYVMNTLVGGWSRFIGWNANCFVIYNNNLYWGGNVGDINQGYLGSSDAGAPIAADMQCAFNWMDEPGRVKRMTMVQPLLTLGGSITPTLAVDTDFMSSTSVAPVSVLTGGAAWDVAVWDISIWPTLTINYQSFLSVDAIGHAMAIRMKVNITTPNLLGSGVFDIGQFDVATFDSGLSPLLPILQVNAFNTILEMGGGV